MKKPAIIADYNKHKLGVDKCDQLLSYYSFLHKSVKWWRKVFFWLLEVSIINSCIIYQHYMRMLITPWSTSLSCPVTFVSEEPSGGTVGCAVTVDLGDELSPRTTILLAVTGRTSVWGCFKIYHTKAKYQQ